MGTPKATEPQPRGLLEEEMPEACRHGCWFHPRLCLSGAVGRWAGHLAFRGLGAEKWGEQGPVRALLGTKRDRPHAAARKRWLDAGPAAGCPGSLPALDHPVLARGHRCSKKNEARTF